MDVKLYLIIEAPLILYYIVVEKDQVLREILLHLPHTSHRSMLGLDRKEKKEKRYGRLSQ